MYGIMYFQVNASVRCIAWRSANALLIGCLDGCVHQWEMGGATKELLKLEGSVLHMRFDHQLKVCLHPTVVYQKLCTMSYVSLRNVYHLNVVVCRWNIKRSFDHLRRHIKGC